jgi:hypothetical protein
VNPEATPLSGVASELVRAPAAAALPARAERLVQSV